MGTLIVISFSIVAFLLLALLVLTVREFICFCTYLWRRSFWVLLYFVLGAAAYFGAKLYLDALSAAAVGILISFTLNAVDYRSYRKHYQELLAKIGLGDSRRIGRKKLLEVYQLGGKSTDRCEKCGEGGLTLDIHHTLPLSEGGNNEFSNLKMLCPNCHRREHDGMRR